jgi:hypothetical protein
MLLPAFALCSKAHASEVKPVCPTAQAALVAAAGRLPELEPATERAEAAKAAGSTPLELAEARASLSVAPPRTVLAKRPEQPGQLGQLIVIGFMGGRVHSGNMIHREAMLARDLRKDDPIGVHAIVFANHDAQHALETVLRLLDRNKDGCLSTKEKKSARIVIYGHSWGASETVALARKLDHLGIPVLLTVQVDSVEKANENDATIPPNVRQAINFYQSEGLLHGRTSIAAMDPSHTTILGNFESQYRSDPVSCPGYPWFARTFMKQHIEIENDPRVWNRIEALIQGLVDGQPDEKPQSGAAG